MKELKLFFKEFKHYIVDSIGNLVVGNIFYGVMERVFLGFAPDLFLKSRVTASALVFLGIGYIYGRGRDIFYRLMDKYHLLGTIKKPNIGVRDIVFGFIFSFFFNILIYTISGANFIELVKGTIVGTIVGLFVGVPMGYSIDLFRDLLGVKKSQRIPVFIENLSLYLKYIFAFVLILVSIGILAILYYVDFYNIILKLI